MTSAANRLLLLNGSSFVTLCSVFLLSIFLFSCRAQRPSPEVRPDVLPEVSEDEKPVLLDTIQWVDKSGQDFTPVSYPEDSPYRERIPTELPTPVLKDRYVITVVLSMDEWPKETIWEDLLDEEMDEEEKEEILELMPRLNERALAFLNGFEFAFRKEYSEQVHFTIEVVAIGENSNDQKIREVFSGLKHQPDLIIGGENRTELESLARVAASMDAVLINPWFPGNFNVPGFSRVVSLQPPLRAHFDALLRHLHSMQADDRFYVVYSPREETRVKEFRNLFHKEFPDRVFGEIFFRDDVEILEFEFDEFFEEESRTFFFLPMTRNHPFIYPILRTLDLKIPKEKFEVLGLTLWDRDVHIELHSKLDVINTSMNLPVDGDTVLHEFNSLFFNKMGYIGSAEEYEAYAIGDFVRRALILYGTDFPLYLPFARFYSGSFRFNFGQNIGIETPVESFGKIDPNLQNNGLFILRFDNGKFKDIESLNSR